MKKWFPLYGIIGLVVATILVLFGCQRTRDLNPKDFSVLVSLDKDQRVEKSYFYTSKDQSHLGLPTLGDGNSYLAIVGDFSNEKVPIIKWRNNAYRYVQRRDTSRRSSELWYIIPTSYVRAFSANSFPDKDPSKGKVTEVYPMRVPDFRHELPQRIIKSLWGSAKPSMRLALTPAYQYRIDDTTVSVYRDIRMNGKKPKVAGDSELVGLFTEWSPMYFLTKLGKKAKYVGSGRGPTGNLYLFVIKSKDVKVLAP